MKKRQAPRDTTKEKLRLDGIDWWTSHSTVEAQSIRHSWMGKKGCCIQLSKEAGLANYCRHRLWMGCSLPHKHLGQESYSAHFLLTLSTWMSCAPTHGQEEDFAIPLRLIASGRWFATLKDLRDWDPNKAIPKSNSAHLLESSLTCCSTLLSSHL